ncbi:MAG: M16 family metallopeptidase [Flavobacteriales bacterium]
MSETTTLPIPAVSNTFEIKIQEAEKVILQNGIPVYCINAGTQEIVRLEIYFDAGIIRQHKPFQAFLTNHMLIEGTTNRTSAEISEEIDFYGGYLNVDYAKDFSTITLHILNKYLDKGLEVLKDVLLNPTFPQNELDTLIKNQRSAYMVDIEKVSYIAQKKLNELLFKGHPYGRISTEEDFNKITREDIVSFYEYYNLSAAQITLSGKIGDKEIKQLNDSLGSISIEKKNFTAYDTSFEIQAGDHFVEKKDAMQSSIKVATHLPLKGSDDFFGLLVLNTIFGGYFGSRLMNNIREDKGWTYGISSYIESMAVASCLIVSTEVKGDIAEKAMVEIFNEMDKLRTELIPKDELEKVRTYMLGKFLKNLDGPFELSDRFWGIHQFKLGYDYYQKYIDTIKTISADELQLLAQKYLVKEKMVRLIAGGK